MPSLQSLVLTDRATPTPVNHTFVPEDVTSDGKGTVVEGNGTKVGENRFQISCRRVNGSGKYRIDLNLFVPIVQTETINGIDNPKVVRQSIVNAQFFFDPASTPAERKNVVGMFQSAFDPAKVLVNDTLVNLQGVYGA